MEKQDLKLNRYFFLAVIILFAFLLLWSLMAFFTAFLASIMVYVLSKPLVYWLTKHWNWRKSYSAALVIVLSFFIILLPLGLFITMLYGKVVQVASHPDDMIQPIKHFGDIIKQKYNVDIISPESLGKIQGFGTQLISILLNSSFNFFTTISMMYFFLYFMIINNGRMEAALILYLPFKRSKMELFGNELKAQTFSNAVGVPVICIVHGLLAFAAYLIAGVKDPGFWGVVTGFASILPLVGTGLIWLPTAIYLIVQGHTWQGFFVIGWGLLIIGTSDNVIRFVLAKRMADVHPIVTVLGVIIGLNYFGITGLIFGPLIISYFIILLKIYYVEYQKPEADKQRTLLPSYFQFKQSANKIRRNI